MTDENTKALTKGTGRFVKGNPGGPGRPRGTKNRMSVEIKELVMHTVENMEITIGRGRNKQSYKGKEAFVAWASSNPERFYTKFLTKLMPKAVEVSGPDGDKIETQMQIVVLPAKIPTDK